MTLHAVVKDGRIVLEEPTDLPEGTVVELEVYSPSTIPSDAIAFLPNELQPAITSISNLWCALEEGRSDMAAFHRENLVRDLELVIRSASFVRQPDRPAQALRQLLDVPPTEIHRQDLVALFDARLDFSEESNLPE